MSRLSESTSELGSSVQGSPRAFDPHPPSVVPIVVPTSAVIAMAVMPTLFVSTPTGIPLDCGHDGIDLRPPAPRGECSAVSADGVQLQGREGGRSKNFWGVRTFSWVLFDLRRRRAATRKRTSAYVRTQNHRGPAPCPLEGSPM